MPAKSHKGAKAPEREIVRANLRLDAEQYRRLLVFSVMESRSAGDIVSKLLEDHLKGWSMPGKVNARVMGKVSVDSSAHVEVPMADLAA